MLSNLRFLGTLQQWLQGSIIICFQIIEMEKEIYLTEALYASDFNQTTAPPKEKAVITPFQSRPESAKLPTKKINNNFLPESYYDDKKVKPGISLYRTILEIEERRANNQYAGPHLKLAIPETVLLNDNSNSMIYTENGVVKVEPFVSNEAFLKKIEGQRTQSIYPYVLHSTISGINFNDSIMMNTEIVGNKIIPRSQGFICRKFVQPYASTPNILRLYFCPKGSRQLKKNYGYKLIHTRQMNDDMFRKKHRLLQNFIVNSEREDSYTITLLTGKALQNCVLMTESLVEYLEKGVFVKASQMVIDFIVDENKQPWLYEIKSIRSKLMTKLWDIGSKDELQLLTQKNNSSHYCKLCGMTYTRQQMEKIVTNKLIWELIAHLQARGVPFKAPPHLRKEGLSYICDICYEVVVAEHKLINVEREFSSLLNLSTNSIEKVVKAEPKLQLLVDGGNEIPVESGYKAWRLFFYIQRIKNYESRSSNKNFTINLQMHFNNLREQFTKVVCGENPEQINCKSRFSSMVRVQSALEKRSILGKLDQSYLTRKQSQSRFDGKSVETMTTMASKVATSQAAAKQSYSIEKVKVYVFYTKNNQTGSLFGNTELEFSLAINEERFNGRSATMQALKNRDTCQRHSSQIFLFDEHLKYCNLELTVGLTCDGEVTGEGLKLVEGSDGIFHSQNAVSVCHPLPDEWMQVFTKGESVPTKTHQLGYKQIKEQQAKKESRVKEVMDMRASSP